MTPKTLHCCTYFDRHYLVRALSLYRSMQRHCQPFVLWVLCFDDYTYDAVTRMELPGIRPISQADFERGDEGLQRAKQNRSRVEYYWTCTPSLPLYVFNRAPEVDLVTYVDADLFFYSSPEPIYSELGMNSILIIGHRHPPHLKYLEPWGLYNVGFLCFRRDSSGLACLAWWRERCLEWCYHRLEDNRMGDQKYLDDWPTRFSGVTVLNHRGSGLAPWNLSTYRLSIVGGHVYADADQLIFYHFHALTIIKRSLFYSTLDRYHHRMTREARVGIYEPYLSALQEAFEELDTLPASSRQCTSSEGSMHASNRNPTLRSLLRLPLALFYRSLLFMPAQGPRGA